MHLYITLISILPFFFVSVVNLIKIEGYKLLYHHRLFRKILKWCKTADTSDHVQTLLDCPFDKFLDHNGYFPPVYIFKCQCYAFPMKTAWLIHEYQTSNLLQEFLWIAAGLPQLETNISDEYIYTAATYDGKSKYVFFWTHFLTI